MDNCLRHLEGKALLAEIAEHRGNLGDRGGAEPLGGGNALCWVHPHVKGAVMVKGEAALRLVKLRGGDAQIEEDAVDAALNPEALGHVSDFREAGVDDGEAAVLSLKGLSDTHGLRIAVNADEPAIWPQAAEDLARMAAPSEGAVHVDPVLPYGKSVDSLMKEHRYMSKACSHSKPQAVSRLAKRAPGRAMAPSRIIPCPRQDAAECRGGKNLERERPEALVR